MTASTRPLLALLLQCIFLAVVATAGCPAGWSSSSSIRGKCYYLDRPEVHWRDAMDRCRTLLNRSDILAVANYNEHLEVQQLARLGFIEDVWLGLSYTYKESSQLNAWQWWSNGGAAFMPFNMTGDQEAYYNGRAAYLSAIDNYWHGDLVYSNHSVACQVFENELNSTIPLPYQTFTCPDGWIKSLSIANKCYRVGSNDAVIGDANFFDCLGSCQSLNSTLVSVNNTLELFEVTQFVNSFTGYLNAFLENGTFVWRDDPFHRDSFMPIFNATRGTYNTPCLGMISGNVKPTGCSRSLGVTAICQQYTNQVYYPPHQCPDPYTPSVAFPSRCYHLAYAPRNFTDAWDFCNNLAESHGSPGTPLNFDRLDVDMESGAWFLEPGAPVWMDLFKEPNSTTWPKTFDNGLEIPWAPNQPDMSAGKDCTVVINDDMDGIPLLYTRSCTDTLSSVCIMNW